MQHAFSPDTLRDREAIVTGASQGIGRAVALELAKVGAHVVACSRRRGALDPVAAEARAQVDDADLPREEWDAMLRTNLTGVFLFSQAVGRVMIRQQSGKIVNVTSAESGRGVGEVRDHRQRGGAGADGDRGRARGVEDVFVASDAANFMTGETLHVSGGPRVANRED